MNKFRLSFLSVFTLSILFVISSCSKTENFEESVQPTVTQELNEAPDAELPGLLFPESTADFTEAESQDYLSKLSNEEFAKLRNDYIVYKHLASNDLLGEIQPELEGKSYSELDLTKVFTETEVRGIKAEFVSKEDTFTRACYARYNFCGYVYYSSCGCWYARYCYCCIVCY